MTSLTLITEPGGRGWPPPAWTVRAMPAAGTARGHRRTTDMDTEERFYRDLGRWASDHFYDEGGVTTKEDRARAADEAFRICHGFSAGQLLCESPIEKMMLGQIVFMVDGFNRVTWDETPGVYSPGPEAFETRFQIQASVGKYRVDFLFCCHLRGHQRRVVVECDGHDYHERTKEQAQRDKARDRYMVGQGITVLRFTGSEIYRDPEECRTQVEGVLFDACESLMAAVGIMKPRKDRG